MNHPIIKAVQLSHRYTAQWAIRDIDFEIPVKGIYGLLGSNGSGKSTMMNIICGVLKPSKGNVFINGINIRKEPIAAKSLIGFLPQRPPLHIDLNIEEYLTHCAGLRLIPRKEQAYAVNKVLELCGIAHFRKRLIRNLSGGYQQRVGIAQAIIHNPELVVLDEPTNGLDIPSKLQFRNMVATAGRENKITIMSTHQVHDLDDIINTVIIIDNSEVLLYADKEDICRKFYFNTGALIDKTNVIYAEQTPQGIVSILPNKNMQTSYLDLEILFNATLHLRHGLMSVTE